MSSLLQYMRIVVRTKNNCQFSRSLYIHSSTTLMDTEKKKRSGDTLSHVFFSLSLSMSVDFATLAINVRLLLFLLFLFSHLKQTYDIVIPTHSFSPRLPCFGFQRHDLRRCFPFCLFLAIATTYKVNVITADKFGSGTNANVYLIIYGEKDDTGMLLILRRPSTPYSLG